jgi:hypothetical protein
MTFGINPISAEATRNALVENDRRDAKANDSSSSRAALDAEELKDLEHSLYRAASASMDPNAALGRAPAQTAPVARRSLIARLFRRG